MTPNNLRSVVALVTRGGSSVVSRRNFSSSGSSYESGGSYFALFRSSIAHGCGVVGGLEIIQVIEYGRTMQRSLDIRFGREPDLPVRGYLRALYQSLPFVEPWSDLPWSDLPWSDDF